MEESKMTFQEEQGPGRQRGGPNKSCRNSFLRGGKEGWVKVSLAKDLKTMLTKAEDGQILEVEDVLSLWKIILEAIVLQKPRAAFKATKPMFGAKGMKASAQALKILEDLLSVELRVIREDATLGIKPKLNTEERGLAELKLQEPLPNM
ncbi:hypothetical protein ACLOJK_005393 [Asimina triloba]